MDPLASDLGIAIVVFASTNIDDIFLLAAFFADPRMRQRSIVLGQYLGISVLVLASALAALLTLAFPAGWLALLGCVPLLMGIGKLTSLRSASTDDRGGSAADGLRNAAQHSRRGLLSQATAVAGVTIANGGDNIGVYVPVFATDPGSIVHFAIVFAVMTAMWCALGFWLVNNKLAGGTIRRTGHLALPIVLIALGLYILSGALVLLN